MRTTLGRLQQQILFDLAATNGDHQSIDDLTGAWPGRSESGVRASVSALYKRALVTPCGWDTGRRRREVRLWSITDAGRAAIRNQDPPESPHAA